MDLGKNLERAARGLRPLLVPAYRRAFKALSARGLSEYRVGEQMVVCDLADLRIDSVGGRYYFSLVRDLIDAGYFPVFVAHRTTLSTFGTSRMKSLLLSERLGTVAAVDALPEGCFLITDREISGSNPALRTVTVDYQTRLCRGEDEMAFPVFVHPQLEGLPYEYQVDSVRPARLFFGGNTEEGKYDSPVIRDTYHMLTRREMLAVAAEAVPAFRPADAASWLASQVSHDSVLCETQHCKIPRAEWLNALGKADFFLACPGVGMPLCHNLIEAMAAGAIPVLQYADYLPQPLTDRENCMVFHDAASLRSTLEEILKLPPARVLELRANVRRYYREILAPGCFSRRLFVGGRQKTLLLNAYRVPRP